MAISIATAASMLGSAQTSVTNLILQAYSGGVLDTNGGATFKRAFDLTTGRVIDGAVPYWNPFSNNSPGVFKLEVSESRIGFYLKPYNPVGVAAWFADLSHFSGYVHNAIKPTITGSATYETSGENEGATYTVSVNLGSFDFLNNIDWIDVSGYEPHVVVTVYNDDVGLSPNAKITTIDLGLLRDAGSSTLYSGVKTIANWTSGDVYMRLGFSNSSNTDASFVIDNIGTIGKSDLITPENTTSTTPRITTTLEYLDWENPSIDEIYLNVNIYPALTYAKSIRVQVVLDGSDGRTYYDKYNPYYTFNFAANSGSPSEYSVNVSTTEFALSGTLRTIVNASDIPHPYQAINSELAYEGRGDDI